MQKVHLVEAAGDKTIHKVAQARTKSLAWSLKAVPGPMVEGAWVEGAWVEGAGEAGQDC